MTETVDQQNAPYPIGHALLTSRCAAGRVVLVFDDIDGRTVDRPAELDAWALTSSEARPATGRTR